MKQIAQDIKNGIFHKLYLIYGEEKYLLRQYLGNLLHALGAAPGNMNYTVFSEKKTTDDEIISICETMPFFAERRVVLLDELDLFKSKREKLTDYLKNLPDYLVLIVREDTADKRSRLYKEIIKTGTVAEFKTQDTKDLGVMVAKKLKAAGKLIRKSTCELFLSKAGTDMNYISCELEKLIAYTGDRQEVTAQDIEEICSPVIENKIFDLVNAAASGDRKTALEKYDDLIILKESPMRILYLLAKQYDQLLHIKELSEQGLGSAEIAGKLKINPYVVKRLFPTARRFSTGRLRAAVEDMVQAEEDVKTGKLNDRISVELMLMKYS